MKRAGVLYFNIILLMNSIFYRPTWRQTIGLLNTCLSNKNVTHALCVIIWEYEFPLYKRFKWKVNNFLVNVRQDFDIILSIVTIKINNCQTCVDKCGFCYLTAKISCTNFYFTKIHLLKKGCIFSNKMLNWVVIGGFNNLNITFVHRGRKEHIIYTNMY